MGVVFSLSNQKGGVGKTTTTCALASILTHKGFRVLAIDLDPQGNLTFCMAGDNETKPTIYEVLTGDVSIIDAIQPTKVCDLISANILLSGVELDFTTTGREFILSNILKLVVKEYDFILIDTPPALSILTVNAFTASDYIIVPMHSDIFSLQGIAMLYDTIDRVTRYCNPNLTYAGILLTRFNPRALLSTEVRGTAEMISENLNIPLFKTFIRASVAISESQSLQQDPMEYAPNNNVMLDYQAFTDELLERLNQSRGDKRQPENMPNISGQMEW